MNEDLKAQIRTEVGGGAKLDAPYLILNGLATVIASYGLLQNSTAVVIGAMLVAMLMGPILSLALGIVDGNESMIRRSITSEVIGALMVLAIAWIIGRIHSDIPVGTEVFSRTSPGILDLLVAIAGGAAGAYSCTSKKISGGMVGVAIATALVPPLSVCGLLLARGALGPAFGAFTLFFANFVAIQVAASGVFFAVGFRPHLEDKESRAGFIRRNAPSLGLIGLLAIGLTWNFIATLNRQIQKSGIEDAIKMVLRSQPGRDLVGVELKALERETSVLATIRSPFTFTPEEVERMERMLPESGKPIRLTIRTVLTKETNRDGYIHQMDPAEVAPVDPMQDVQPAPPEPVDSGSEPSPADPDALDQALPGSPMIPPMEEPGNAPE
ncbi:MAG: TIGR00341 family protein [Fimbriimonadaceae bacterium]|nr:TIGR00341 family protein [Fimbriimonadaceae bacterium]